MAKIFLTTYPSRMNSVIRGNKGNIDSEQIKTLDEARERFRIAQLRYFDFSARASDAGESNTIPASNNDETGQN